MITIPAAYELISRETIEDVNAEGYLLRHKKSGARIALLLNDDENKVFNIAFRTPPADSTGVAHILEHSVLCGSEKFPLKDPFVELAKGSLNTFLNAMTYPDKTMYPIASCNDADFQNLMDVYLDAVFHPNIYREEKIFRQEGWHYHLEDPDGELTYNGVVYNEMKGAFSSSDEMLERTVFNTLFPDTAYGVESGGDPECIPDLTYEAFLDFHRRYYHPSNSYIYFYGNLDAEQKLIWLDEAYLASYDYLEVDSALKTQAPFDAQREVRMEYPVLDDEPLEDNTYLAHSAVVGSADDVERGIAFAILDYVLLSSPGAPVKQALLDAGIGKDIEGSYDDGILQPFFTVVARGANEEDKDRFETVIRETLEKLSAGGIDRKALASGINYFEFRFREADYANYPKGLIYGIHMFDSWLYHDDKPFSWLRQLPVFAALKKKAAEGYFEELIRTSLLDNPHSALVVLAPKRGLAAENEEKTAGKLRAYKNSLSAEEIASIAEGTAALKAFQEAEDSEEAILSLPVLSRSDIGAECPVKLISRQAGDGETTLLRHDFYTNGIGYLTLLFDTAELPDEWLPCLGLLRSVLGAVSTEHYSYGELFHEINARTGGIFCGLQVFPDAKDEMGCRRFFGVQAKYLFPEQPFVFEMIREILLGTDFSDKKRLREIIASVRARLQNSLPAAGHATAARRAMSYLSPMEAWQDRTAGISFYHFVEEADDHFEERADELIRIFGEIMCCVFRPENLTVSLTAGQDEFRKVMINGGEDEASLNGEEHLLSEIRTLREKLGGGLKEKYLCGEKCGTAGAEAAPSGPFRWEPSSVNEAWKTAGQVQYVASAGNFLKSGFAYTGALRVLRIILSYDYLWLNIRVKGGAYGCMSAFQRTGAAYLVSYRDPHLAETLDVYRALPEYLKAFNADDREMTRYIIGTISELDTPLTPSSKGAVSLNAYFSGLTEADLQKERDQILGADSAAIRSLAELVSVVSDTEHVCVVGSESAVEKNADLFGKVAPLS